MVTAVYIILNNVDGKKYVGSAINVARRLQNHRYRLNKNTHVNAHLQASWNKYGENCFDFIVWDVCDRDFLLNLEQCWMDYYRTWNCNCGYNIRKNAENNLGFKHSEETKKKIGNSGRGKKRTEQTKKNISKALTGKPKSKIHNLNNHLSHIGLGVGSNNSFYGKHHTLETREKMSKLKKGIYSGENHFHKLNWDKVREIRSKYRFGQTTYDQLAIEYMVTKHTIYAIIKNKIWKVN